MTEILGEMDEMPAKEAVTNQVEEVEETMTYEETVVVNEQDEAPEMKQEEEMPEANQPEEQIEMNPPEEVMQMDQPEEAAELELPEEAQDAFEAEEMVEPLKLDEEMIEDFKIDEELMEVMKIEEGKMTPLDLEDITKQEEMEMATLEEEIEISKIGYAEGMSITSLTKRNLTQEILKIDEKVDYINKLKDEAVESLMQKKRSIIEAPETGDTAVVDDNIAQITKKHSVIVQAISARQELIRDKRVSMEETKKDVEKIEIELAEIQERHGKVLQQLDEQRRFLRDRLGSIEKLDTIISSLEATINMATIDYKEEMKRLQAQREALLARKDLTPSELALKLAELDKIISDKEKEYKENIRILNQEIAELRSDAEASIMSMRTRKEFLENEIKKLLEARLNASPSQILEIDRLIAQFTQQLKELEPLIEISGLSSREKLNRALELRGLSMTPSGQIRTASGRILSILEARDLGLLDGLDKELLRLRGLTLTESGRILTASGELFSRSEAERLGLFKVNLDDLFGQPSESEASSESSVSSLSGMSSEDVHYLKTVLGKPLTLALAEITAKQPRDPIHYLAHWLMKYRHNEEMNAHKKKELEELIQERERLAVLAMRERAEEEAREILLNLLGRVELEIEQRQIEAELRRIEAEAIALEAQQEDLEYEALDVLGVYGGPTTGQQL